MRLLSTPKVLLLGLGVLALNACRKDQPEPGPPEYADWYALRAPEGRAIQAVAGNIDSTLVISTRFAIYQTKDRGKTWLKSNYTDRVGIEGFAQRGDTLLAMTATAGAATPTNIAYAVSPYYCSLDKGATWQKYFWRWQPSLDPKTALNRATSPAGVAYETEFRLTPMQPSAATSYVETIGIKNALGTHLTLPHDHTITSIAFDRQSRLYVTASAALCGQRENFAFCGEQNGILYVSKKPQP
ncbi:MAG TPA: hypothetical protein VFO93_20000 [Hymenobacter sp.]|uniref:hypothetical protein n=1 Tax=Hymenobacter sp. TaxID=1898978 RepID=UPI002D7F46D4|nr:hypothetical protein [Hymenobacter sp.]HET9505840.1 hypothetical protein [Hymenobacter sp.]